MVPQSSRKILLESNKASHSFSDSHKKFNLTHIIKSKHGYKMLLNITNAEIPVSFFNINSNNNTVIQLIGNTPTTYNIPPRNYNGLEIASLLSDNPEFKNIEVTYNQAINKFSFKSSDGNNDRKIKTNEILGLSSDIDLLTNDYTEAQNQANFGGIRNIYVKIKNLGIHNLNSSGIYCDIITKIPIDEDYSGVINYTDQQNNFQIIDAQRIREIEVELVDKNGKPIGGNNGLGGLEWTLTLVVIGRLL